MNTEVNISHNFYQRDFFLMNANEDFDSTSTQGILYPLSHATTDLPVTQFTWENEDISPIMRTVQEIQSGEELSSSPTSSLNTSPTDNLYGHLDFPIEQNVVPPTTSKKRKLSQEQKIAKRKQQTRTASKVYREKRKNIEKHLLEQLAKLEEEKNILLNEQQAAQSLLTNLKEENEGLKRKQVKKSEENDKERHRLLTLLEQQLRDNVDDKTLSKTLLEIKGCCGNVIKLGQAHLEQLISPNVIETLLGNGFFDGDHTSLDTKTTRGGISDLVNRLKTEVKNLSAEQIKKLDTLSHDHYLTLTAIYDDRKKIIEKIRQSISVMRQNTTPSDNAVLLTNIELLRRNFFEETKEWTDSIGGMLDETLTPRQMAQFCLKIEFEHISVRQLKNFWNALNNTWDKTKGII